MKKVKSMAMRLGLLFLNGNCLKLETKRGVSFQNIKKIPIFEKINSFAFYENQQNRLFCSFGIF